MSNGLCISPLKAQTDGQAPQPRSLRDVVYQIDNDRDFKSYMMGFASKVGPKPAEIKYERHPVSIYMKSVWCHLIVVLDPSKCANNTSTYASSIATATKSIPTTLHRYAGTRATINPTVRSEFQPGVSPGVSTTGRKRLQRLSATVCSPRRLRWCPSVTATSIYLRSTAAITAASLQQLRKCGRPTSPPTRIRRLIRGVVFKRRFRSAIGRLSMHPSRRSFRLGSRRHLPAFRHDFTCLKDQSHV